MSTNNPAILVRRSHTKSKHGCQTCRARRVKCDEFRPHCRNCLLARRSCRYLTTNAGESGKAVPSLSWPRTAERSCEKWKDSGEPQFPFLQLPPSPNWHHLSMSSLRHMHHLALVASILELSKTRQFCLWWSEFLIFVQLALRFEFVAHAVVAHSAGRLAQVTKLSAAFEDAAHHRTLAFQGLNQAIDSFSRDNADAILCASLCLSNQETDWRAWRVMMEGISAVVNEMQPWIRESVFFRFLDHSAFVAPEQRIPTHESSTMVDDGRCRVPILESLLAQGIGSLNRLSSCSKDSLDLSAILRQLRDTCRMVHEKPFNCSVADQFRLVHPFAAWMDKYTRSYLAISEGDSVVLASLAHFFAVIVALALAFPGIDLPLVAPIRLDSIIKIDQVLRRRPGFFCGNCKEFHDLTGLMAFPLNTVYVFRELQGSKFKAIM